MASSRYISQGEQAVGHEQGEVIATILGSCVATCLWDPVACVGGMNHFLLPDNGAGAQTAGRYGAHAMEVLINALIRAGGDRRSFRAKVFGGANLRAGLTDAGERNARFVLDYLERENIPCLGHSLGGTQARRVEFWPAEGRARQRLVEDRHVAEVPQPMPAEDSSRDLELF